MGRVIVVVFHRPGADAGPLGRMLADARRALADRLVTAFRTAGADEARVAEDPPDDTPFGARLRSLARRHRRDGLVVLGSGALPLAGAADLRSFVEVAASGSPRARANGRFSADIVALGGGELAADVPDLLNDNLLPRWLEQAGVVVDVPRGGWRLAVDIDSPLDLVLAARAPAAGRALRDAARSVRTITPLLGPTLEAVRRVMTDPHAELLVAGRTSAATLRWLERRTASRTRALVEERGLRASGPIDPAGPSALASSASTPSRSSAEASANGSGARRPPTQRPPASVLADLLEPSGRWTLGDLAAHLGEAALIDSRVLLAARLGADERGWPPPEDRFASDLLLADRVRDPWLKALTSSACDAPVPVLLGGHTLVGPALRLIAATPRSTATLPREGSGDRGEV
jgi:hypothetical protein